ncbi:unnamed protein product [Coregonus sp. 'balchen']|nr:unnamed protein product [Coregonus sp. 'balchen']
MSATRYRRFLKLCEEWPRDESKKSRDLGTFLRQRVAHAFREGNMQQMDEEKKGLWKTLTERFSPKPEDITPEKAPENK